MLLPCEGRLIRVWRTAETGRTRLNSIFGIARGLKYYLAINVTGKATKIIYTICVIKALRSGSTQI